MGLQQLSHAQQQVSMAPEGRFHIIYHIIATSVERNSYRIIKVGIYTHFSSKSISQATMLPLIALVFQEDNVSR
jgi:hypothetical protein